jgi:hypothetical protein
MKKLVIVFAVLIISGQLKAHDPSVSSFHLSCHDQGWTLRAEFPWSIRNALIKSYPFLAEKGVDQTMYEDCLKEYVEINFEAYIDGNILKVKRFYQVSGDHGHSFTYIFEMDGPSIGKQIDITNTCMFELYQKQRNMITIKNAKGEETCTISKKSKSCSFRI